MDAFMSDVSQVGLMLVAAAASVYGVSLVASFAYFQVKRRFHHQIIRDHNSGG